MEKIKNLLLSLSLVLFAAGLAVPPQALNAGCYKNSHPKCPDNLLVSINFPPDPNPPGAYNCYGFGTYKVVADHTGSGFGYSQWAPSSQPCPQTCTRYVGGIKYSFDHTITVEGSQTINSSFGCSPAGSSS